MKIRFIILFGAGLMIASSVTAQQHVIADKNNTRPEMERHFRKPVGIAGFTAIRQNGYNEIRWSAIAEDDVRKYIVEFSEDGVNYQSGGEVVASRGDYDHRHQTFSMAPMLYRLKIEELDGKYQYSANVMLEGVDISPVSIYPTIVRGNVLNIVAGFPVERITVISGSGERVYTQEVGGRSENMTITLPTLAKGMYWISFDGRGWRSTEKFMIG